jgi:fructosamine-3-kinase
VGLPAPPASTRFFEIYQELNPSPPGWTDRMPILDLREHLSVIAAYGSAAASTIYQVRDVLAPFYSR